jgi:hypothetical protein
MKVLKAIRLRGAKSCAFITFRVSQLTSGYSSPPKMSRKTALESLGPGASSGR